MRQRRATARGPGGDCPPAPPGPSSSEPPLDVVVVDHHDSYTWNLVHLVAAVTGALPAVVEHDEVTAEEVLAHSHVLLSPGPGHPADPHDFAVGGEVLRRGTRPVLGVCLGMQGMVTTYGGTVGRVAPAHGEVAMVSHDGRGVLTGLPSDMPWSLPYFGEMLHPVALYRAAGLIVVLLVVWWRLDRTRPQRTLYLGGLGWGLVHLIADGFAANAPITGSFRTSQVIGLVLALVCTVLLARDKSKPTIVTPEPSQLDLSQPDLSQPDLSQPDLSQPGPTTSSPA